MICTLCGHENTEDRTMCSSCGAILPRGRVTSHVLQPGTTLLGGAYTVGLPLGQGAFAITYAGQDTRLARPVAIKEFFPSGCDRHGDAVSPGYGWPDGEFQNAKDRFLREGQSLARFRYPGIVHVLLAFEANNTAYLAMELLKGQTLREVVRERGALPEKEALTMIRQAASALEVVHAAGLLHRDIKPANLMRTDDERVVLIDFGAAKEYIAGHTQTHSVVLTPGYAPLEQYALQAHRGPFSDVYALAATLYYLLTAELPRPATDRLQGLEPRNIREVNPAVSERTAAAITHGMAMDAAARPQTVAAWMEELPGKTAAEEPETTAIPARPSAASHPAAPPLPRKRPYGMATLAALALLAGLAFAFTGKHNHTPDANPPPAHATVTSSDAGYLQSGDQPKTKKKRRQAPQKTHSEEQTTPESPTNDAGRPATKPTPESQPPQQDSSTASPPGTPDAPQINAAGDRTDYTGSNGVDTPSTSEAAGDARYGSARAGFSIYHPRGWRVEELHDADAKRTWFHSPDGLSSIMVEVAPGQSSDYPNGTWKGQDGEFRSRYGNTYRRIGVSDGSLGGLPSVNWAFVLGRQQKLDVLTYHHGTGYAVLCTAPASRYDSLRSDFKHAIDSFRFTQ